MTNVEKLVASSFLVKSAVLGKLFPGQRRAAMSRILRNLQRTSDPMDLTNKPDELAQMLYQTRAAFMPSEKGKNWLYVNPILEATGGVDNKILKHEHIHALQHDMPLWLRTPGEMLTTSHFPGTHYFKEVGAHRVDPHSDLSLFRSADEAKDYYNRRSWKSPVSKSLFGLQYLKNKFIPGA